jgi:hypothetical protein
MNLVMKRAEPEAIVFVISNAEVFESLCELARSPNESLADVKWIGLFPSDINKQNIADHLRNNGVEFDATLDHPASVEDLFDALDEVFQQQHRICSTTDAQAGDKAAAEPIVAAGTV